MHQHPTRTHTATRAGNIRAAAVGAVTGAAFITLLANLERWEHPALRVAAAAVLIACLWRARRDDPRWGVVRRRDQPPHQEGTP